MHKDATPFEMRERIALRAAPWVAIGWTAVLVSFLFVDLSKVYLLAIFPLVYIFVTYQVASHIAKKEYHGKYRIKLVRFARN